MAKQPNNSKRIGKYSGKARPPLKHRPWLRHDTVTYDLITRPNTLHADISAYQTLDGSYWYFKVIFTAGGRADLTDVVFRAPAMDGLSLTLPALTEVENLPDPAMIAERYWARETHAVLRHAHPAIMRYVQAVFDNAHAAGRYLHLSTRYHYVRVHEGDETGTLDRNNLKRPKVREAMERRQPPPAPDFDPDTGKRRRGRPRKVLILPDWL